MSEDRTSPAPHFDPEAAGFEDLTLSFDTFFHWGETGQPRLGGRRFLRCNLAGPTLAVLGDGNQFSDNIFSACSFIVTPEGSPVRGGIQIEDCLFEDCILTRWALFVPPRLAVAMARDMPEAHFLGMSSLPW